MTLPITPHATKPSGSVTYTIEKGANAFPEFVKPKRPHMRRVITGGLYIGQGICRQCGSSALRKGWLRLFGSYRCIHEECRHEQAGRFE